MECSKLVADAEDTLLWNVGDSWKIGRGQHLVVRTGQRSVVD